MLSILIASKDGGGGNLTISLYFANGGSDGKLEASKLVAIVYDRDFPLSVSSKVYAQDFK